MKKLLFLDIRRSVFTCSEHSEIFKNSAFYNFFTVCFYYYHHYYFIILIYSFIYGTIVVVKYKDIKQELIALIR